MRRQEETAEVRRKRATAARRRQQTKRFLRLVEWPAVGTLAACVLGLGTWGYLIYCSR